MQFGRKPRAHDDRIPKLSQLKRSVAPPVLPPAVDYGQGMPAWLGMMGNDFLGDCTCAAVYHAMQVWTANANPPMDTEADADAIRLYELSCGYVPGNPSTDQGGVEQEVLKYWLDPGAPRTVHGQANQRLVAFVELDQRVVPTVREAIFEGGLVYIGFLVPATFDYGSVWHYVPGPQADQIVGGHAVVLTGYNDASQLFTLISWGQKYQMTYEFFERYCDEAYLLANEQWIAATGRTPAGQTLDELEALMTALRWTGGGVHFWDRHRWHKRKRRQRLGHQGRLGIG